MRSRLRVGTQFWDTHRSSEGLSEELLPCQKLQLMASCLQCRVRLSD